MEGTAEQRVKFYGLGDYGTYAQTGRAAEVLALFDPSRDAYAISDVLEFNNAQLFAENDLFPSSYSDVKRAACRAVLPQLRATIAKFFNRLNNTNAATLVAGLPYDYHGDLLELLSKYKVYERCAADTLLPILENGGISVGEMLTSHSLVRSYDQAMRDRMLSDAHNAVHIVGKYLEGGTRRDLYLPPSFTGEDARSLLDDYLDSDDANPNVVELISTARVNRAQGIDAKTKLKAQRKHEQWTRDFFKENSGIRTGCEVSISTEQAQPVEVSIDGLVTRLSYSRRWLEDNLDSPTVLNNFIHLFEFVGPRMLLNLPSYQAHMGVFERLIKTSGRHAYAVGVAFRFTESAAFLQTAIYDQFLRTHGIDLESVIEWFFTEYLSDNFGAPKFVFVPTSRASTYLEKCRHIFAEMESVARQFSLYTEDGELDTELLGVVSEQVRYAQIPSRVSGKYVYVAESRDISTILHLLFSDQSRLTYINEGLKAENAAQLLVENGVAYDDFADHQRRDIDFLIERGILSDTDGRVGFTSARQLLVLRDLVNFEAANYYHYSPATRAEIESMITVGWLRRSGSLFTEAEASYFNYYLNQVDFSNGPDLRNRYLHGSHVDARDEDAHHRTYITALQLLVALVIKINDDFCLRDGLEVAERKNPDEG